MTDLTEEIKTQKIKKYKKRVFFLLRSLYRFFQGSPTSTQLVDQYMKVYRPLTDHADASRLPFKSKGKKAIKRKRIDCFFAMLNNVIEKYWKFCEDQENESDLLEALIETEDIVKNGLGNYKVIGSDEKGYWLE